MPRLPMRSTAAAAPLSVLLLAASSILAGATAVKGQVIESYEGLDRAAGEGVYATVAVALDLSTGNSEFVDVDMSGAVGFRGERHWVRFYPSYRFKEAGSAVAADEQTAHLRHSYIFSERSRTYAFVQFQSDRALELERRVLVGGGYRLRIVELTGGGLDVGVGAMWEEERLETGVRTSLFRGANLVSASGTAGPMDVTLTAYLQPALGDWADHRIAANGTAAVPLGEAWALTVSARFRRDSDPPPDVDPNDAGLTVGLRFAVN